MTAGLPARGDIIRFNSDRTLAVLVLTDPVVEPSSLDASVPDITCWTMRVRYLNDHPTGPLDHEDTWGIRGDQLHLYAKVGVVS